MQPFELVISIMIADLASIPMADIGIPITNGIIPILALLLIDLLISFINLKSIRTRRILCGKPSILIERLREKDIFNLKDIEYAILETSGQITVIKKPDFEGIPYDLVIDGKVMNENLKKLGKDYTWLKNEIKKFKIKPEDALIITIDGKGEIFCQAKEVKK